MHHKKLEGLFFLKSHNETFKIPSARLVVALDEMQDTLSD